MIQICFIMYSYIIKNDLKILEMVLRQVSQAPQSRVGDDYHQHRYCKPTFQSFKS